MRLRVGRVEAERLARYSLGIVVGVATQVKRGELGSGFG
jgi:hypothetical protein